MADDNQNPMFEVLTALNTNLARLGANRVPPPSTYNGSTSVATFFRQFEAYCTSIYGDEKSSWLQILPSFTDGEPRAIVESFGMGAHVTYQMVKERLIAECERRTLGSNKITDFYAATRRSQESLLCFSIRLQILVGRMNRVLDDHKRLMLKTKFVSCLKPVTVTHYCTLQYIFLLHSDLLVLSPPISTQKPDLGRFNLNGILLNVSQPSVGRQNSNSLLLRIHFVF